MTGRSPYQSPIESPTAQSNRHLLRWFLAGSVVVFVSLLLLMDKYVYTGDALLKCKLWEYYLIVLKRSITLEPTLRPTTGEGMRALWVFLVHLAIAGIGGLLSLGIGVLLHGRKIRPAN